MTAEFAVAMPALVVLVLAAVACVGVVTTRLRCDAAAREAALVAARGGAGEPAGAAVAPPGATVLVDFDDDTVHASVRVVLHPFGPRMPGVEVVSDASAAREPGLP